MTSPGVIEVAIATDESYLPWCATGLLSCLQATTDQPLHFHVLHEGGIRSDSQARLAGMVEAHGGTVQFDLIDSSLLAALPTKGPSQGGRISWARVLLPEILPGLDRVIYLDADVLAAQSLAPLWAENLGDAVLGAVLNVVEPAMHPHVVSLGIRNPHRYFNAGVLLLDLAAMRAQCSWERISELVRDVDQPLEWFDQDALNVVFADRWKPLDPRWNVQSSFWSWNRWAADALGEEARSEAVRNPAIVHFEGPLICKPWHFLCPSPYRERYLATLSQTPWSGEPPADRTIATRLIRRLPTSRRIPAYLELETCRRRGRRAAARLKWAFSHPVVAAEKLLSPRT